MQKIDGREGDLRPTGPPRRAAPPTSSKWGGGGFFFRGGIQEAGEQRAFGRAGRIGRVIWFEDGGPPGTRPHVQAKSARLTEVERSGDPDEPVTRARRQVLGLQGPQRDPRQPCALDFFPART